MKRWVQRWEGWVSAASDRPWRLLALFAALMALQINPYWLPGEDASQYLAMARNLAHGQGITAFGEARLISPPGYPLVLSLAFVFGDTPFLAISILHWLMGLAVMTGVFFWSRAYLPRAAPWLAGLVVLGASFSMHNRITLTESTFMAALLWTVLALRQAVREVRRPRAWLWSALGAAMIAFTVSVRLLGVMLLAGFALAMLRSAWRDRTGWGRSLGLILLASSPAILGVAALLIHDFLAGAGSGLAEGPNIPGAVYLKPLAARLFDGRAGGLSEGLRLRVNEIGRLLMPGMVKAYDRPPTWLGINTIVYLLPTALVVVGWWRLVRRESDVLALAAPFYLLVLVLWPFDQAERFGLPMLPLYALCAWSVLASWRALSWWPEARLGVLALLLIGHLGVAASWWLHDLGRARDMHQDWPALEQVAAIVRRDDRQLDAWKVEPHQRLMLRYLINRPVNQRTVVEGMSPRVYWLLAPADVSSLPPGFAPRLKQDRIQLLQKQQTAQFPKKPD